MLHLQDLKFMKPVYIGDTCTATVTVIEKKDEKHIIILDTVVSAGNDENVVIKGQAVVKKP